jgi:hypothetical protein
VKELPVLFLNFQAVKTRYLSKAKPAYPQA